MKRVSPGEGSSPCFNVNLSALFTLCWFVLSCLFLIVTFYVLDPRLRPVSTACETCLWNDQDHKDVWSCDLMFCFWVVPVCLFHKAVIRYCSVLVIEEWTLAMFDILLWWLDLKACLRSTLRNTWNTSPWGNLKFWFVYAFLCLLKCKILLTDVLMASSNNMSVDLFTLTEVLSAGLTLTAILKFEPVQHLSVIIVSHLTLSPMLGDRVCLLSVSL